MLRRILLVGVLVNLLVACSSSSPTTTSVSPSTSSRPDPFSTASPTPELAGVRTAFERYRSALLNKEGITAALLVTQSTLRYYDKIQRLAVSAPADALDRLPVIDKVTVAYMRILVSPDELRDAHGVSIFIFGVERGLIGRQEVRNSKLGRVEVDGDFATGELIAAGKRTTLDYEFHYEESIWKVDLVPFLEIVNSTFEKQIRKSGLGEDAFITAVLSTLAGRRVGIDEWKQPVGK